MAAPGSSPTASTTSVPTYRQPAVIRPVTATVTLVPEKVASTTPSRVVRQEPSSTIGAAPFISATVNEPVKLVVGGFAPGSNYVIKIKGKKGYVVLGSVTADANGRLALPVFRNSKPSVTTIAIVTDGGQASYLKVSATAGKAGSSSGSKATSTSKKAGAAGSTSRR